MSRTEKAQKQAWSFVVLFLVGTFSLLYILFKQGFAKIYLDFSYLNFPIFIGEMLLFLCLLLLACYWIKYPPQSKPQYFFIFIYLLWFVFKIITGYQHGGPLAFRHAALFYYPFFAMIGFVFFNRDVFTKGAVLLLFSIIVGVFAWKHYDHYWALTLACLGLVLILGAKERKWTPLMATALIVVVPYIFLFKTARMMFVANTVSLLFIMAGVVYLWKIKSYIKVAVFIFVLLGISFGFYKFFILGESGRIFESPAQVANKFREMDKDVQAKEKTFKMEPSRVGLYHSSEAQSRFYYYINPLAAPEQAKPEAVGKSVVDPLTAQEKAKPGLVEKASVQQKTKPEAVEKVSVAFNYESFKQMLAGTSDPNPSFDLGEANIGSVSLANIVFRLFIWRDMFEDWKAHKPLMGFDLGRPLRSPSLEVLHWAEIEWGRDGWIEPHNSYFNILYRAGIVGIILVVFMWGSLFWFIRLAFVRRSWILILLAAILLNWMVAANFLLILELPYTAIPFWTLAGMAFAYACKNTNKPQGTYEIKR